MSRPLCLCGCGERTPFNTRRQAYNKYVNDRHRDRYKDDQRKIARAKVLDAKPAPLCACGCGEYCVRPTDRLADYPKYLNAQHRHRADDRKKAATAKVRRCACGCGKPVFHRRRYVDTTHRASSSRIYRKDFVGRVPGDLTTAQIERIMTQARAHIRYRRNTDPLST
jgi:hypothetical protein